MSEQPDDLDNPDFCMCESCLDARSTEALLMAANSIFVALGRRGVTLHAMPREQFEAMQATGQRRLS